MHVNFLDFTYVFGHDLSSFNRLDYAVIANNIQILVL